MLIHQSLIISTETFFRTIPFIIPIFDHFLSYNKEMDNIFKTLLIFETIRTCSYKIIFRKELAC